MQAGRAAIVADWAGAGAFFGLLLGAILGLVLAIVSSLAADIRPAVGIFAAFGLLVGGLLGLAFGVAIGVISGVELACLSNRGWLGQTQSSRRRSAALAAGLTSAVVSFAIISQALGAWTFDANWQTWLYVFLPTVVATLVALRLSQVLEPTRSDVPAPPTRASDPRRRLCDSFVSRAPKGHRGHEKGTEERL